MVLLLITLLQATAQHGVLLLNQIASGGPISSSLLLTIAVAFIVIIALAFFLLKQQQKKYSAQEEKLKAACTSLQASLESHTDVLIFSIDRDYRYLHFNTAFRNATLAAYHTTVVAGSSMLESITNEEDRKKAKQNCDRSLAGESHITVERYGEAHVIYFKTRYQPVRDSSQKIIGVSVMSADITEGKLAQEQVAMLTKEMEAFSYSIAHDLRTPLRAIHAYTQVLLEDYNYKLDEECQSMLSAISRNANTMGQMVDDLLNFSKFGRTAMHKSVISPSGIIKPILEEQITGSNREKITVELGNLENLYADRTLMQNVFSNLISNAIKFSRTKDKPFIKIDSHTKSHEIIYSISDNGVGFDMKYEEKLFGVFHRLHKATEFEGTGVGLAVVQRIILRHGGKVWAEAKVDQGATFYFSLPAGN